MNSLPKIRPSLRRSVCKNSATGLQLVDIHLGNSSILCDISTGKERPLLPPTWTKQAFEAVHNLSHPGIKPTQRAVTSRFVWHGLKRDVRRWCQQCPTCQPSKIQCHVHSPFVKVPSPDRRFGSIHVDIVGPLPVAENNTYLFTIVD